MTGFLRNLSNTTHPLCYTKCVGKFSGIAFINHNRQVSGYVGIVLQVFSRIESGQINCSNFCCHHYSSRVLDKAMALAMSALWIA